jgi:hypothetical protein
VLLVVGNRWCAWIIVKTYDVTAHRDQDKLLPEDGVLILGMLGRG